MYYALKENKAWYYDYFNTSADRRQIEIASHTTLYLSYRMISRYTDLYLNKTVRFRVDNRVYKYRKTGIGCRKDTG